MIISARYTTVDHDHLVITLDNGDTVFLPHYPSFTRYDVELTAFIDSGGFITDYDEHYGKSDAAIRIEKYNTNSDLADIEILAAESQPTQAPVLTAAKVKKENTRRLNRAKGILKLTDADDALADHIDTIMDVLDSADDTVENLTRAELYTWDGSTITWPVWTPPVQL